MAAIALCHGMCLQLLTAKIDYAMLAVVASHIELVLHHHLENNSLAGIAAPLHGCASASQALYNVVSNIQQLLISCLIS